ncbi:MAG: quinolinate synthase [Flavobacteriaceae bacterium]|nr:quinolinate synthase [Flavobacteriaceae bacterium]OUX40018.1 MAG: quinolinate synthase [Flavobacteriaceae bacterium TMED265]
MDVIKAQSNLSKLGYLNLPIPKGIDLKKAIKDLKTEKNAVLLAHYYQNKEIQELADYLGDSLYLAKAAQNIDADIIVFAGVHFMAETAKIINPSKKVLLPDLNAGCSLADSCPPQEFAEFKANYPKAVVVTYINCSAEIKALSDIVCTSSNAVQVIESIDRDTPIIFAPDKNLGRFLIKETGRDLILWDGSCIVHEAFSFEKIVNLAKAHPKAKFIAHPESESQVLDIAHYIGSTSGLLNFVQNDDADSYIVGTEAGIIHEMKKVAPHKNFIPAPVEDDTCACSECAFMKLNTLEKLYLCIEHEKPEILMDSKLMQKALKPIEKMLRL